uniref:Glycosyl transferase family 1 domain-containing protein n=1 Tax=Coccolithus braarudii TaxID=221442 RepID=A0A7S0QB38_9EUKA|mmetsp:Transcript_6408/g.13988  ORF Transcript_6408/g.13988 Transcript_6408/m.13988 type:complete len:431 (+) Transcript_6408:19-1311(+)
MALTESKSHAQRLLLLSYEFTYAPFSGNGMLARSLVKGLINIGCEVTVICCRPVDDVSLASDQHLTEPEIQSTAKMLVWPVQLRVPAVWKRLDRAAAWEQFAAGAAALVPRATQLAPDACIAIDWTGGAAWRAMCDTGWGTQPPKLMYMNFRVYSSGMPPDSVDAYWYEDMERRSLAVASAVLCLSTRDRDTLLGWTQADVGILPPPLREDVLALARAGGMRGAMPTCSPRSEQLRRALADCRKFVVCVVRLSPEKAPMLFAQLVGAIAPELRALGLVPLMCGAAADAEYAMQVKAALRSASVDALLIDEFLGPDDLAALFARSVINIHPCVYDAYGMTLVEAAAFAVPSVVQGGGAVGATALLGADKGASFELDLKQPVVDLAATVLGVLRDELRCRRVGDAAQALALAWTETAYAASLLQHLHGLGNA